MFAIADLIVPDEAVLSLGSLNAEVEDRRLGRENLEPAQFVVDRAMQRIPFFDTWGELGVCAMALVRGMRPTLHVATGSHLVQLTVQSCPDIIRYEIASLQDVPELSLLDGPLWLANKGYDEAVGFDLRHWSFETAAERKIP